MSLFQSQTTPRISVEYTKRVHETNHHRHALLLEMVSVGIKRNCQKGRLLKGYVNQVASDVCGV